MTTALIEPIKPRINGSYYHCYNFLLDELPGQIHLKHNLVVCTSVQLFCHEGRIIFRKQKIIQCFHAEKCLNVQRHQMHHLSYTFLLTGSERFETGNLFTFLHKEMPKMEIIKSQI